MHHDLVGVRVQGTEIAEAVTKRHRPVTRLIRAFVQLTSSDEVMYIKYEWH